MQYAAFGSIVLGVGIALFAMGKRGRFLTIMFLLAGFSLTPILGKVFTPALSAVGGFAGGIAIGAVLASAGLTWTFFAIKEKKNDKRSPWIALVAATLLLSSGIPIYNSIIEMGGSVMESGNTAVMNSGR